MQFFKGGSTEVFDKVDLVDDGDANTSIYYFSYGVLTNPIARRRRGVCTDEEQAALLFNHRLHFSYGGSANIMHKEGWQVYGVVMKCSSYKDWKLLKEFDAGYDCMEVDVYPLKEPKFSSLHEGEDNLGEEQEGFTHVKDDPIRALVFVLQGPYLTSINRLPQERYLRVIASGLRAYNVDPEYINDEIMSTEYIPTRKERDYLTFPPLLGGKLPTLSLDTWERECQRRLARASKSKNDKNLILFRLGSHAIQVASENAPPDNPVCVWLRHRLMGSQDSTFVIVQTLYDPDLPFIATPEEVTPFHQAWAENQMMEKLEQADVKAYKIFQVRIDAAPSQEVAGRRRSVRSTMTTLRSSISSLLSDHTLSSHEPSNEASPKRSSKKWRPKILLPSSFHKSIGRSRTPSIRGSVTSWGGSKAFSQISLLEDESSHPNNDPLQSNRGQPMPSNLKPRDSYHEDGDQKIPAITRDFQFATESTSKVDLDGGSEPLPKGLAKVPPSIKEISAGHHSGADADEVQSFGEDVDVASSHGLAPDDRSELLSLDFPSGEEEPPISAFAANERVADQR